MTLQGADEIVCRLQTAAAPTGVEVIACHEPSRGGGHRDGEDEGAFAPIPDLFRLLPQSRCFGGQTVNCDSMARDVRGPQSNWEIPA